MMLQAMKEPDFIHTVLKGDPHACALAEMLFYISQVWDDLIDQDRAVDAEKINHMMWLAMLEIPANTFYLKHQFEILPLIRSAMVDYMDANHFEDSLDMDKLHLSFVLRDTIGAIITHMAYLIGGYDWMRRVSPEIRAYVHNESFDSYVSKLQKKEGTKE